MSRPIILEPFSADWGRRYAEESARLYQAIGKQVVAIEHIGSTAIPGMSAKPVIDIMIGLNRLVDSLECLRPLREMGYVYVPQYEAEMPFRRFFYLTLPDNPDMFMYHLHMVEHKHPFWEQHLLFRDYLRANADAVAEFDLLKQDLVARGVGSRAYALTKMEYVDRVVTLARDWRQQQEV